MIGAATASNRTRVPARVRSTSRRLMYGEKRTSAAGPRSLPLMATISPGAIAPAAELAEFFTSEIVGCGLAFLSDQIRFSLSWFWLRIQSGTVGAPSTAEL